MVNVYAYSDSDELSKSLTKYIIQHQNEALSKSDKFTIAISGGSLIKHLANGLLDNDSIDWPKWVIYFSDERLVPLANNDSNYGAFNKSVLEPLAHSGKIGPTVVTIDESMVHKGDDHTDGLIAKEYESEIPSNGLDLVLLGCGPDGHTCSLFPNHRLLTEAEGYVSCLNDSPKLPKRRITLTLSYLGKSGSLCFVAEGASKQKAIKEIFENRETSNLPCALVNRLENKIKNDVSWFVSEDAIENVIVEKSKY